MFLDSEWLSLSTQQLNASHFLILSCITCDYLAVQGSSVPSERVFSNAGLTDTKCHSSMLPSTSGAVQTVKARYKQERHIQSASCYMWGTEEALGCWCCGADWKAQKHSIAWLVCSEGSNPVRTLNRTCGELNFSGHCVRVLVQWDLLTEICSGSCSLKIWPNWTRTGQQQLYVCEQPPCLALLVYSLGSPSLCKAFDTNHNGPSHHG